MSGARVPKSFRNGDNRAAGLPAEFRLKEHDIYAARNDSAGDVVISATPDSSAWTAFFAEAWTGGEYDEFMVDRPLNTLPPKHDLFFGEA